MATNNGPLKTEIDTVEPNPPINTHKHDILTKLHKAFLFPETSTMIFAAVKNKTVG